MDEIFFDFDGKVKGQGCIFYHGVVRDVRDDSWVDVEGMECRSALTRGAGVKVLYS